MNKLLPLAFAAVFCFSTLVIAAPVPVEAARPSQVVEKTKTVYHHGRRTTVKTWHRSKYYTKKGWHKGKYVGRKVVIKTKHVVVGKPRHRRP